MTLWSLADLASSLAVGDLTFFRLRWIYPLDLMDPSKNLGKESLLHCDLALSILLSSLWRFGKFYIPKKTAVFDLASRSAGRRNAYINGPGNKSECSRMAAVRRAKLEGCLSETSIMLEEFGYLFIGDLQQKIEQKLEGLTESERF